jgi:hypothetical protein
MVLHVDLGTRRAAPFPATIAATLAAVVRAAPIAGLGRRVGMRRGG